MRSFIRFSWIPATFFALLVNVNTMIYAANPDIVEIKGDEQTELVSAVNSSYDLAKSDIDTKVNVKVVGINSNKLNENVQLYIKSMDPWVADGSELHKRLLTESIDKALRVFGYYHSKVVYQLENTGTKPLLIASVDIGDPVRIEDTNIDISGEAKNDPTFQSLFNHLPHKGTILEHEDYENYKSDLEKLARQRGYFDWQFTQHQLKVMPSTNQGWWNIGFDSGDRYRYGEIRFQHAQIREDYLRAMLKVKSGDGYLISDLSEMTNDYSSSGWFQSVMVKPILHEKTKLVDLDLLMYPKKKNRMELGLGYATDSGMHGQVIWTKPWINNRGHSVRTNLYVSSPKQTLEAAYKMPLLKNPLNYYYEFSVGAENENGTEVDTKATSTTIAVLRYWNHSTGWQYSTGLRARYDSFTQTDIQEQAFLFYPTVSVNRIRYSGGAFPTRADKINVTVDWGRRFLLSDMDFFRIRASAGWVKQLASNHRFLIRGEIGYLHTHQFNRTPPALRFFAGGDGSVRGYGYKKISPKDANGKLLGASRLATAGVEYQYQVIKDWWLANFFDAGFAANQFYTDELRYGTGMGLRWASPIGAIKFDVAIPVRDKDKSKNIQFYIGLGSEL